LTTSKRVAPILCVLEQSRFLIPGTLLHGITYLFIFNSYCELSHTTSHICGLRTSSKSTSGGLDSHLKLKITPQIVDDTNEDDQQNQIEKEIELEPFVRPEQPQDQDLFSVKFVPISNNQDVTLHYAILQAKKRRIELRLSHIDAVRRQAEDAEDAQQRYQDQTVIESLKSIHLILDSESTSPTTVLGSETSSAQKLLQARMCLLEGLKSGKLEAGKSNKIEGSFVSEMIESPLIGTVSTAYSPVITAPGLH
jgi:hypothetical protein